MKLPHPYNMMLRAVRKRDPNYWRGYMRAQKDYFANDGDPFTGLLNRIEKEFKKCLRQGPSGFTSSAKPRATNIKAHARKPRAKGGSAPSKS